ncbi:hypothetical protein ACGFNU_21080 [Spirillospora sp. NPDC048911]|uniref:hypothetical protein n=1 Tax=Spirillospora sp. NPDC048911 TaxID=3364527 RepID=UPI00371513A9
MITERLMSRTGLMLAALYTVFGFVVAYALGVVAVLLGAPTRAAVVGVLLVAVLAGLALVSRVKGSGEPEPAASPAADPNV